MTSPSTRGYDDKVIKETPMTITQQTLDRLTDMIMKEEENITGADAQDEINALWEVRELVWDIVNE